MQYFKTILILDLEKCEREEKNVVEITLGKISTQDKNSLFYLNFTQTHIYVHTYCMCKICK